MTNDQTDNSQAQFAAGTMEEVKPQKNFIRDFFGIISNPTQTFKNVLAAQYWVPAVLTFILLSGILQQIYFNQIVETSLSKAEEKVGDNPQALDAVTNFFENEVIARPVIFLNTEFVILAIMLIAAVLYFFISSVIFGGTAKFKGVWIVSVWSSVIILLSMIISTPLILATGSPEAGINVGLLAPIDSVGEKVHNALAKIDLFGIWHFIVAGLGLAVLYKFSTKKGIGIAFIVWLLFVVISGAIAFIS